MKPGTNWKGGKGQYDGQKPPMTEDLEGASDYYADLHAAQVSVGSFSDPNVDAAMAEASTVDG